MLDETLKEYITKVEESMKRYIPREPKEVYEPLREYLFRGGKRIRPLFLISYYYTIAENPEEEEGLISLSALLELFHNFTLIHDDIEDNSDFRRGKPTLHRMLGVPMALNTGDALYTIVWRGLLNLPLQNGKVVRVMKLMQKAFQQVVEGQGIELSWYLRNKFDVSVEEYYGMVRGKTGALFGCACACAALLAGKEQEEIKEAYIFGEEVGIAFQIQDDILNIAGDFEKYKKEIGGDISEGKRTLLTIGALNNAPDAEAEELISILKEGTKDSSKILRAIEIIRKNKGIEFAQNMANQHIKKVSSHLDQLPDSEWKRRFERLVKFTVSRDH